MVAKRRELRQSILDQMNVGNLTYAEESSDEAEEEEINPPSTAMGMTLENSNNNTSNYEPI